MHLTAIMGDVCLTCSTAFLLCSACLTRRCKRCSSWNCFGGAQSQEKMETVAEAIVALGLRDLGYVNLAVDGGWESFQHGGPPPKGSVGPHGWNFTNLTAYYHSIGLKLGMYVTGGFEAVYQKEAQWAEVMFGEWGADGVKVDHMCRGANCGTGSQGHMIATEFQRATIERWVAAIAAVGKTNSTLFQNCGIGCSPATGTGQNGGLNGQPWEDWCPQTANMWRSGGDANAMWGSIVGEIANLAGRGQLAGPGGWNYPDSLEVGNARRGKHLTPQETRAHFALYCITSSPLILGNDVRNMSSDDLAVVSNKLAIGVNQAWAGFAGDMLNYSQYPPANASAHNVTRVPPQSVWWKPLPNNSAAVVLFNQKGGTATISFRFEELQWQGRATLAGTKQCHVADVWSDGDEVGVYSGGFSAEVNGSAAFFAIITGCESQA
jgi:alpha-galactosidase